MAVHIQCLHGEAKPNSLLCLARARVWALLRFVTVCAVFGTPPGSGGLINQINASIL